MRPLTADDVLLLLSKQLLLLLFLQENGLRLLGDDLELGLLGLVLILLRLLLDEREIDELALLDVNGGGGRRLLQL